MADYVGGLRARLVRDSVFFTIKNTLGAIGWFDAGRRHQPLTVTTEQQNLGTEIPLNTLAVTDEGRSTRDIELGSNFSSKPWVFYADFFAESDSLSIDVSNDIADILEGRFPAFGRVGPVVQVYDYTQATPTPIFYVDIESVRIDRGQRFSEPYLRHWRSVQWLVVDYYNDTTGGG